MKKIFSILFVISVSLSLNAQTDTSHKHSNSRNAKEQKNKKQQKSRRVDSLNNQIEKDSATKWNPKYEKDTLYIQ